MSEATCPRCHAPERDYRVRGHHGLFCLSCRGSWDAAPLTPEPQYGPVYVRPEAVKMQEFRGRAVEVMRIREVAEFKRDAPPVSLKAERCILPAQTLCVAESTLNFAFDPETGTLYVSDAVDGGYLMHQARNEETMGRPLPFQRAVNRAEDNAREAYRAAERAREDKAKALRLVTDATARLKSPKPGVRRRAKRLLEKLGR